MSVSKQTLKMCGLSLLPPSSPPSVMLTATVTAFQIFFLMAFSSPLARHQHTLLSANYCQLFAHYGPYSEATLSKPGLDS